ncbi:hypothetical protein C9374_013848 [Naegleria lovaniensis]|uniref:Uncharacterized protein n=1 Tax=Naegleria lovaniensis TaxID=51637 RepID=A0AA88KPC3_NAELO|nr:uncharacterized protein C9374_013848 [Naegleria lovaniensis]KAG2389288.1 hypothetical protein C9374_013848 [Naegleria lovaniensis]
MSQHHNNQNKLRGHYNLETSKGTIRIMENYEVGTCGSRLWSSAPVLCKYLEKHANKLKLTTTCRSILEVGAGCGISSILLAKLGCPRVVATDREIVLPILKQNILYNCNEVSKNISCEELEWLWACSTTDENKLKEFRMKTTGTEDGTFDCIIGSDVVYEEPCIEPLLKLLTVLSSTSTLIFIAYEIRNDTAHELFLEKAATFFSLKKIPTKQQNSECMDERVLIYQLKKESQ